MAMKQNFADQLKAQSDIWTAAGRRTTRSGSSRWASKARGEYEKAMEQMEAKAEEARKLAEQVRGANEAAWKDMVGASQKAFAELQKRLGRSDFAFPEEMSAGAFFQWK